MVPLVTANDTNYWHVSELTARIVAASGIPSDRFHLGKIILQSLKDAPDFVLQIDAATGKSENFKSALERSVRCALSLKKMGLKYGDVIGIIGHHYLESVILYYSALYLGIKTTVMDPSFKVFELKEMLKINRANIIFSQNSKIPVLKEAMNQIGLNAKIVSFEDGNDMISFANFIEECGDVDVYAFKPTDFDPDETIASLIASSGTTGLPKLIASTHKNYMSSIPGFCIYSTPYDTFFLATPSQGMVSMVYNLAAPILKFTKIQTSASFSVEHYIEAINRYKPQVTHIYPPVMFSLINSREKKLDLSCFRTVALGGSPTPEHWFDQLQILAPKTLFMRSYGITEVTGSVFRHPTSLGSRGSLGQPRSSFDVRLVDPGTLKDITEPHVSGELWLRGPSVVKGYYQNSIETKTAFVDGWFRTGDIFYRDDQFSFYFVDRLKLLLKYRTNHVSPTELEKVIRKHPGVLDVVVVGIPDLECGDLPSACIVPHPDTPPTAQEIKNFVKERLSDPKQLRGGVLFMDEFPLSAASKVDRKKLKAIAIATKRE